MVQVDLVAELRRAIIQMEVAKRQRDQLEQDALNMMIARAKAGTLTLAGNLEGLADAWLATDGDYKAVSARYRSKVARVESLRAAIGVLRVLSR